LSRLTTCGGLKPKNNAERDFVTSKNNGTAMIEQIAALKVLNAELRQKNKELKADFKSSERKIKNITAELEFAEEQLEFWEPTTYSFLAYLRIGVILIKNKMFLMRLRYPFLMKKAPKVEPASENQEYKKLLSGVQKKQI